MEASLFSTSFVHLDKAQQGIIRAIELAADTVDEIAKGSEAQQSTLEQKCRAFLEEVQGDYWNNRFQNEQQYDWFKDFSEFKHLCVKHLRPDDSILILGCGNSTLTQDLYDNGFINLTSTDLSEVVIHHMHKKAAALHQDEIKWQVADMLDLPYADATFDVVIEKGTMDVLFVDNDNPFEPKLEVRQRVFQMLNETHRVLKAAGSFLSVTFAQPHFRKPFLLSEQFTWNVDAQPFGENFHYYVYVMRKNQRKDTDKPVSFGWPSRSTVPSGITDSSMQHDHMDHEDFLRYMDV